MGSDGFSGPSSLLYHVHPPTRVLNTKTLREETLEEEPDRTLRMRHFHLGDVPESTQTSSSRSSGRREPTTISSATDRRMKSFTSPKGAEHWNRSSARSRIDPVITSSFLAGFYIGSCETRNRLGC